jgi:hypothetical protein
MSRTVFRDGPFRAHFFSLEESRMHVHVQSPDGEVKIWIEPTIELARTYGLTEQDLNRVLKLVREREQRSEMPGTSISRVDVTNISQHGFWMLVDDRELFLPFDDFPWFKAASIEAILNVMRPKARHLYWPDLDVDLTIDSIEHPGRYPLKARVRNEA